MAGRNHVWDSIVLIRNKVRIEAFASRLGVLMRNLSECAWALRSVQLSLPLLFDTALVYFMFHHLIFSYNTYINSGLDFICISQYIFPHHFKS